ncbi:MAG: arsenosugar biosynthesis radical SAM protein ArsS [Flavobacteriales bacterium]|nr:arsenosugar biosynthesis radical SAM protein ArsS [Flavobacteriales bacterium]
MNKSLHARHNNLADPAEQLKFMSNGIFGEAGLPTFKKKIESLGIKSLRPSKLEIFQVNVGYMCNQVCSHCHVDAGPDRKEIMARETMTLCLIKLAESGAHTLDITGGAPEMNPDFRWFIEEARKTGVADIIVRCNLTIILANKKYHDLPEFFAIHKLHVVSSLPFYKKERTDKQRGDGVFDKSIEALKMLNSVGYGEPNSGLKLDLVYNPAGAFLPNDQAGLEREFKKSLYDDFGIRFNSLLAITNMPISRYLEYLIASDNYEDYMDMLVNAFNPSTIDGLMCRNTLSIRWDGYLYDCDFNQMLDLKVAHSGNHISEMDLQSIQNRDIVISQHCFGCTAGSGSSCQGATT